MSETDKLTLQNLLAQYGDGPILRAIAGSTLEFLGGKDSDELTDGQLDDYSDMCNLIESAAAIAEKHE